MKNFKISCDSLYILRSTHSYFSVKTETALVLGRGGGLHTPPWAAC